MTLNTTHTKATRYSLRQAIAKVPAAARAGGATANAMMIRCGMALLGRIKQAFIVKARGGTDDCGESWKPLSPKTIAYSRRHPGVPKPSVRAASRPSWMLTDQQNKRWWDLYRQGLAIFKGDRGSAARRAWAISRDEGAETLLDKYGKTQVDILRDTGLLLNSLSPGTTSGDQVLRIGNGEVTVGTNRKHAGVHHRGNSRTPQRRLWAEPRKWASTWWADITDQARAGLVDIAMQLIKDARR